jgi:hypothetical protein
MRNLAVSCAAFLFAASTAGSVGATAPPVPGPTTVMSAKSGPWSSKGTWDAGRIPKAGDRVVVRAGHHVGYDVDSREVIRLVQVAGTLEFAADRNTRLEVGLLTITASEEPSEQGFDCHASPKPPAEGKARPALIVGRPGSPIPSKFNALIRLHYIEGMDKASCPAIVCCGGRMDFHGAPMARTWLKLNRPGEVGTSTLSLEAYPDGWKDGDRVIVTGTKFQREGRGRSDGFIDRAQTEARRVTSVGGRDFTAGYALRLDKPLSFAHAAEGDFRGEVANLSRNVVVESADPDGVRGHTMYHRHSAGSIGYAEFRHLGKKDELGRYSIHYHLCGETMRGSSVIGASIWDSHNRWVTIHGTNALVVRDCVGYKSLGHGFFLEDGTEVNNILDRNLAAVVAPAKKQEKQVVPFDLNRGAGFWWANCQNSFTRNVAAECAEYGYRFDCKKTDEYDPVQPIRQPDGTMKKQDTRIMPFVRFEDNEAHSMRFFCMNLRGVTRPAGGGLDLAAQTETLAREAAEARPVPGQPFWIRNFRCWEANWSLHLGTTGVFVDGLDTARSDVAIWRSIMDGSGFRRITSKDMRVNDIHNPISSATLASPGDERVAYRGVSSFKDVMPPTTVITHAVRDGKVVVVRGSCADASDIKKVTVNGRRARSTRGSFAQWEITLEATAGKPTIISAHAEDVLGHVEPRPHKILAD